MANENKTEIREIFSFLADEQMEGQFANINIKLLGGRHIQKSTDRIEYAILNQQEYFDGLKAFYQRLYGLELNERQVHTNDKYFYLDYFDGYRRSLSPSDRHIALTEAQTIFGLIVLNMYYEKFIEREKHISWSEIRDLILYSERQEGYKQIFLGEVREGNNYTDPEWARVKNFFKSAVLRFDDLGWVSSTLNEDLGFTINTSIHRFEDLYRDELENPNTFFDKLKTRKKGHLDDASLS